MTHSKSQNSQHRIRRIWDHETNCQIYKAVFGLTVLGIFCRSTQHSAVHFHTASQLQFQWVRCSSKIFSCDLLPDFPEFQIFRWLYFSVIQWILRPFHSLFSLFAIAWFMPFASRSQLLGSLDHNQHISFLSQDTELMYNSCIHIWQKLFVKDLGNVLNIFLDQHAFNLISPTI